MGTAKESGADYDRRMLQAALLDLKEAEGLLRNPSPAALDRCAEVLGCAVSRLREWRAHRAQSANPAALAQARTLQTAIRRAARLLESAAEFRARWSRIAAVMCAGYTASGAPAVPARSGKVCVRG